jgi:hypothetical protein
MTEADRELYEHVVRAESARLLANPPAPPPPVAPPTIHFSELPEAAPGSRGAADWNLYRREVGRLLAEGHEGRWVLIAGEEVVGLWDTEEEANRLRVERYLNRPVLMKQILTREPVVRCMWMLRQWR